MLRAPLSPSGSQPHSFLGDLDQPHPLSSPSDVGSYVGSLVLITVRFFFVTVRTLPGNPQPLKRLLAFAYIEVHSFAVKLYGE